MTLHENTILHISRETGYTVSNLLNRADEMLTARGVDYTVAADHADRAHLQLTPTAATALRAYCGPGSTWDRLEAWDTALGIMTPARALSYSQMRRGVDETGAPTTPQAAPEKPTRRALADPNTTLGRALTAVSQGLAGRFIATVYQTTLLGAGHVFLVVVDMDAYTAAHRFPSQAVLDVTNLAAWEETTNLFDTHLQLTALGWMPRTPASDESVPLAGWKRHSFGNSITVDPIAGKRRPDGTPC